MPRKAVLWLFLLSLPPTWFVAMIAARGGLGEGAAVAPVVIAAATVYVFALIFWGRHREGVDLERISRRERTVLLVHLAVLIVLSWLAFVVSGDDVRFTLANR